MTDQATADLLQKATQWWSTDIIDMKPGVIRFRGFPIEQLIGRVSFPQMIWLMLKGDLPSSEQGALLEAALVSAVDHGPQAPSIAIGRMAVTCGLPLNGAMASAINVLDDIHAVGPGFRFGGGIVGSGCAPPAADEHCCGLCQSQRP